MNKKAFLLALGSTLFLGGISSCGTEVASEQEITFGKVYVEKENAIESVAASVVDIDHATFDKLIQRKDNFIALVCDINDSGCGCWAKFASTIAQYLKKTNLLIYTIAPTEFANGAERYGLEVASSSYETIAIFVDGSLKYQRKRDGTEDSFATDYATFAAWMDARVKKPSMLYVNKDQLDALKKSGKSFVIGYERTFTCDDCAYVLSHLVKTRNALHEDATSYLINVDVNGIRYYNGEKPNATGTADQIKANAQWTAFKDDYLLSNVKNTALGYATGFVPTWQAYDENGELIDMAVYVNDQLTLNESKVSITRSYYDGRDHQFFSILKSGTPTKLLGIEVPSSDYEEASGSYYWNYEAAAVYHDPLLNGFFDLYLKNTK